MIQNHVFRIPFQEYRATLFLFGDLQADAKDGFSMEAWQEFRKAFKSNKNAWGLGLGDYGDWIRPMLRAKVQQALSGDQSARRQADDQNRQNTNAIIEMMEFMKGRLIGLHTGHHCWEYASGDNSDMRIAAALKAPYLGWMAATRLAMYQPCRPTHGYVVTMVSMHGTGNSRYATTDSRWLENNIVPAWGANIYAKGHACKSVAWSPYKRNDIRRHGPPGIDERVIHCLNVPGFHEGYTNGWDYSYVERNGFLPQSLGWGEVEIHLGQDVEISRRTNVGDRQRHLDVQCMIRNFSKENFEEGK